MGWGLISVNSSHGHVCLLEALGLGGGYFLMSLNRNDKDNNCLLTMVERREMVEKGEKGNTTPG